MEMFFLIILSSVVHMAAKHHQTRHLVDVSVEDYLYSIRDKILSRNFHFHYDWSTNGDLTNGLWSNFTSSAPQIPVMVVVTELATGQTGNILGNFLQYVSCGQMAGAHLVILDYNRQYDFRDPDSATEDNTVKRRHGENFFETIPAIIVNQHPALCQTAAIANYEKKCGSGKVFPWEDKMPIAEMIPYFRKLIRPAIDAEMAFLIEAYNINSTLILPSTLEFEHHKNTRAHNDYRRVEEYHKIIDTPTLKNILNKKTQVALPFYPDVTIHWRCSDNVFFGGMGLIPYRFILNRLPKDTKFVFIVTEASFYDATDSSEEVTSAYDESSSLSRNHELCVPIITELVRCIRQRLPKAQVVVRAGGTPETMFLTAAMLVYSKITFCSESTFCFHFATSKPNGKLYLPENNGIFYDTNLDCCDNDHIIETLTNAFPITDWRHPGKTLCPYYYISSPSPPTLLSSPCLGGNDYYNILVLSSADDSPMVEGVDANATEMIAILHNESYPFHRSHRRLAS